MNCTKAEQLIPLDAGGDLQPLEAQSLRQHIETCAHCQQVAEGFADSQTWLSEFAAPSFDEALFADLRASVRREIEQTESAGKRGRWFEWLWPNLNPRFAMAAAVASLILAGGLAFFVYRHRNPSSEVVVKDHPPKTNANQPSPTPQSGLKVENHQANDGRPRHSHANRHRQRPQQLVSDDAASTALTAQSTTEPEIEPASNSDLAKAEPEMLRIEFQTADPNIRIIWLTPKDSGASTNKPTPNTR